MLKKTSYDVDHLSFEPRRLPADGNLSSISPSPERRRAGQFCGQLQGFRRRGMGTALDSLPSRRSSDSIHRGGGGGGGQRSMTTDSFAPMFVFQSKPIHTQVRGCEPTTCSVEIIRVPFRPADKAGCRGHGVSMQHDLRGQESSNASCPALKILYIWNILFGMRPS